MKAEDLVVKLIVSVVAFLSPCCLAVFYLVSGESDLNSTRGRPVLLLQNFNEGLLSRSNLKSMAALLTCPIPGTSRVLVSHDLVNSFQNEDLQQLPLSTIIGSLVFLQLTFDRQQALIEPPVVDLCPLRALFCLEPSPCLLDASSQRALLI
jgi:hypothetical protein